MAPGARERRSTMFTSRRNPPNLYCSDRLLISVSMVDTN